MMITVRGKGHGHKTWKGWLHLIKTLGKDINPIISTPAMGNSWTDMVILAWLGKKVSRVLQRMILFVEISTNFKRFGF